MGKRARARLTPRHRRSQTLDISRQISQSIVRARDENVMYVARIKSVIFHYLHRDWRHFGGVSASIKIQILYFNFPTTNNKCIKH